MAGPPCVLQVHVLQIIDFSCCRSFPASLYTSAFSHALFHTVMSITLLASRSSPATRLLALRIAICIAVRRSCCSARGLRRRAGGMWYVLRTGSPGGAAPWPPWGFSDRPGPSLEPIGELYCVPSWRPSDRGHDRRDRALCAGPGGRLNVAGDRGISPKPRLAPRRRAHCLF